MQKFSTQVTLFIIVAVLTAVSFLTYRNLNNYILEVNQVRHANHLLRALETTLSTVKDAETGHRGYQLTRDTAFLYPYNIAVESIIKDIKTLDSLVSDNAKQSERVDTLQVLINKQFIIISSILANTSKTNLYMDEYEMNLLLRGKQNMDQIRRTVNEIENAQLEIYAADLESETTFREIAPFAILVYSLLAIGASIVLFYRTLGALRTKDKAEKLLLAANAELMRSNKDLEQFAYVASHDLQEPLRKIRSFGDLLVAEKGVSEEANEYIKRMQKAASRMQTLIQDLLSFSRVSRASASFEDLPLKTVVQEVIEDIDNQIKREQATINISNINFVIKGDKTQIKRLFQNLISNAIKFHKNEMLPNVTISGTKLSEEEIDKLPDHLPDTAYVKITIEDNGIGFDNQYIEQIFNIFQRLHGRMDYEGTGIGLAICRKIVMNHNGYIIAESQEGIGSKFIVILQQGKNIL